MIIDSALYRDGQRTDVDAHWRELRTRAHADGDFVWIGLHEPSPAEIDEVAEVFGLHPLAVEDAVQAHQRPKLERVHKVIRTAAPEAEDDMSVIRSIGSPTSL